ncbi:MAG: FHA domain-containing protein, partial [Actinomycetia bacterium]|nr:FHA domain-containing protein [Actinomycetes bacterium]
MSLTISYKEDETIVEDGTTVLIGSDAASTIRIVRPGISRRHAVISYDGDTWKVEDAGSRNGIFLDGQRIQTVIIDSPTTLYLGHPTDGEAISFAPAAATTPEPSIQDEIDAFVITDSPKTTTPAAAKPASTTPAPRTDPTRVQPAAVSGASGASGASEASEA